jgi:uncharacterized Tic20 family protein
MVPDVSSSDRNWAIYANACGLLIFTNIPFLNIIVSLFVWLKVRNDPTMPFARAHATTALNFQLTWTIFALCFMGLLALLAFTGGGRNGLLPIFVVAYVALALLNVLLSIIGCARASDVKGYQYPLTINFVH